MRKDKAINRTESWEDTTKMYIGPTISGVAAGTVYTDGYTPKLLEYLEKTPAIGLLLVSIRELPQAKKELRDNTTARSHVFDLISKTYE